MNYNYNKNTLIKHHMLVNKQKQTIAETVTVGALLLLFFW